MLINVAISFSFDLYFLCWLVLRRRHFVENNTILRHMH